MQLSCGIQETKNDHFKDFHKDGKIKLSNNSDQYEKGQDQEWNRNALQPAKEKTSVNLTSKAIRDYILKGKKMSTKIYQSNITNQSIHNQPKNYTMQITGL